MDGDNGDEENDEEKNDEEKNDDEENDEEENDEQHEIELEHVELKVKHIYPMDLIFIGLIKMIQRVVCMVVLLMVNLKNVSRENNYSRLI